MHILGLAGGMVLTPGVALKIVTPEDTKSSFLFRHHVTLPVLVRRKTNQPNNKAKKQSHVFKG
jgi:hypothetical protein